MKYNLLLLLFSYAFLVKGQDDLKIVLKLDSSKKAGNNITSSPFDVNHNKIYIGLSDGNKDGTFGSHNRDGIYIKDSISFKYKKAKDIKYLNFYGAKFKIYSIDPLGKKITLSPTKTISEDSVMYFESKIRNLPFTYLGKTKMTYEFLDSNKLLLIVSWSEFCSPCIEEIDKLKALQTKHKDKLTILALFSGTQEDLSRRVKTHDINYQVGLINDKIKIDIQQGGFPYKILISEDGTVLMKTGRLQYRKRFDDFEERIEKY